MRNSIFSRVFKVYAVSLVIGFGLLAIILSQLFSNYFIEKKKELLISQGKKISREFAMDIAMQNFTGFAGGGPIKRTIDSDLRNLDKFLGASIWLVDKKGVIQATSSSEVEWIGKKVEESQMKQLTVNTIAVHQGSIGPIKDMNTITVGYPLIFVDDFEGGVFIHAPLPEVAKTYKDIYGMSLWALILSSILSYGILYWQTKKISQPLKEISEASKVIAGGEFQRRLKISTGDEIEELAKNFNEMAESLQKIDEMRSNLIANISHDLRSPMTSIRGFIEGILDGTIPEESQHHYLAVVLEESKRLVNMTNSILELSSMQQGTVVINRTDFEINELLRRKLISFEKPITAKNINVELILFAEKTVVNADLTQIERVVSNLLDNAVKFTPEGREITIRTSTKEDKVFVDIVNTGTTIDTEELKKVWDRFHKGDVSRGKNKNGFGLGLSIVKEILKKHDEVINVESKDDYVKFSFSLKKV